MKECLHCHKEFNAKKDTAKFCSVSCRVMNNRKKAKSNVITKPQMSAMYNSLMEAIANMGHINSQQKQFVDTPLSFDKMKEPYEKPPRSFDSYKQARIECETQEQWEALKKEIMNDVYLSTKQKNLLIS